MNYESNPNRLSAAKQRALDRLMGHPDTPRRPLTGYEHLYEVASDGALYSIRLKRFLKPVYNHEKNAAELEFEFEGEPIRMSPGKAVAMSFFTPAQRERIADEAYEGRPFESFADLKGHPSIEGIAYKYDVSEGSIFYILVASVAKGPTPPAPVQVEPRVTRRPFVNFDDRSERIERNERHERPPVEPRRDTTNRTRDVRVEPERPLTGRRGPR